MSTLPFVVFVAFGLTSVGQNQNASGRKMMYFISLAKTGV